jgi:DNA invertase Pin-like site-specific DNA recombinase
LLSGSFTPVSAAFLARRRSAIQQFAANETPAISAEFVEFETGKGADALDRRPQLAAALAAAKASKCSVVVAKFDRLSRDVAFVAGLMATLDRRLSWPQRSPPRALPGVRSDWRSGLFSAESRPGP